MLTDEQILTNLSANLRALLEDRGLSQRQLAAKCGESHVLISSIINGVAMPGAGKLARVAAALKTTVDYLVSTHADGIANVRGTRPTRKAAAST